MSDKDNALERDIYSCPNCYGIKFYEGDAPLPRGINLDSHGLTEHHCGYIGAPTPRFTFRCPYCALKDADKREQALRDRIDKLRKRIIMLIPNTWLDGLLSGDDAVVGNPPYNCGDIQNLLIAIKERLIKELDGK